MSETGPELRFLIDKLLVHVIWIFEPCETVMQECIKPVSKNLVTCDLVGETKLLLLLEAFPTNAPSQLFFQLLFSHTQTNKNRK